MVANFAIKYQYFKNGNANLISSDPDSARSSHEAGFCGDS